MLGTFRFLFHEPEFYWFPFFKRGIRGTDFSIFTERFRHLHTSAFFDGPGSPFTYPAPAALVYAFFLKVPHHQLLFFLAFCLGIYVLAGFLFGRALFRTKLGTTSVLAIVLPTLLLAYPELFLLDRGNIEAISWIFTSLGVWAYWRKRWYTAGFLIGIAAALKLFPFILLALLLSARRYVALLIGAAVMLTTTVLSTLWIGPTYEIASHGIAMGLDKFRRNYALVYSRDATGFDHSLFTAFKLPLHGHISAGELAAYMAIASVGGLLLYGFRIRKLPRANQVASLITCMVLLPPVSFEYTLVHLLIVWAVLVLLAVGWQERSMATPKGILPSMLALAWLLSTQSYLILPLHNPLRLDGLVQALVLVFLLATSVTYPWPEREELINEASSVKSQSYLSDQPSPS